MVDNMDVVAISNTEIRHKHAINLIADMLHSLKNTNKHFGF